MKRAVLTIVALAFAFRCAAGMPVGLTTEYQEDPVGIDVRVPRLSWQLPDGMVRQCGYQLETDGIEHSEVQSNMQIGVLWPGEQLKTASRHTWRVRVRDEGGRFSDWSAPASFVVGQMDGWQAVWIGPNAFSEILFKPEPIPQLDWVRASVGTPYGAVEASWRRHGDTVSYRFVVPPGAMATLELPGRAPCRLPPGIHEL